MDEKALQFQQCCDVLRCGVISLSALERIVEHDRASLWSETPGGLARNGVLRCCKEGLIKPMKLADEVGDPLYGQRWPLPLDFK